MVKNFFLYKKVYLSLFIMLGFFVFLIADTQAFTCGADTVSYGGHDYQTVQIGDQCWFKENLNVGAKLGSASTMPANPAPTINNPSTVQKWCYNNATTLCNNEGGLYTWAEANALSSTCNTTSCTVPSPNQGICPTGWHIPTDQEFMTLEEFLGMCSGTSAGCSGAIGNRGTNQGAQISLYTPNGTNSSGFSALLTGYRETSNSYNWRDSITDFWSASESNASESWRRYLYTYRDQITRYDGSKNYGLSVRCVADEMTVPVLTTLPVSNIGEFHAQGNAEVTDIGADNPERLIQWGTTTNTYTMNAQQEQEQQAHTHVT